MDESELITSLQRAVDASPDDVDAAPPPGAAADRRRPRAGRGGPRRAPCSSATPSLPGRARADGAGPRRAATPSAPAAPEAEQARRGREVRLGTGRVRPGRGGAADVRRLVRRPRPRCRRTTWRASGLTLADVGGMTDVKKRLERRVPGADAQREAAHACTRKSLRGGLLLYGPPGCGKTFIARALAGELGARFMAVSLADVLDMYVGNSEKNVHELFEVARASAPCVLFLDEVDAIGHKRSRTAHRHDAEHGQPAAARARQRRRRQRGRVRAGRDQPSVGRRHGDAPARAARPHAAGAAARPRGPDAIWTTTCATGRSPVSTSRRSRRPPRATPAPTSPTSARARPRTP